MLKNTKRGKPQIGWLNFSDADSSALDEALSAGRLCNFILDDTAQNQDFGV